MVYKYFSLEILEQGAIITCAKFNLEKSNVNSSNISTMELVKVHMHLSAIFNMT
jgi:hypothetical protein